MRRLLALACILLVSGCGSSSFLGGRYDNFTAYYNTFYNAQRSFDKGEKATRERTGSVDRQVYQAVFPVYDSPSTSKDFEEAIRKSADVLRDHGGSKWVDDALLLIGKSYFYQQNYFAAEEKFREVVELRTKREDEARYWLARTLLGSLSYDALRDHLIDTFERERTSRTWAPFLQLVQGELLVRQGRLEDAVDQLAEGAQRVRDRRLRTRAHFLLGQIYESRGQYDSAIKSYKSAQRKNSDFDLVFAAQVSIVRVESAAGDTEAALRELRKMERDDKNFDQVSDLRAVRARVLLENDEVESAMDLFEEILRSEDRVTQDTKGDIHYRMASVYRDVYKDFTLAAAHFDTGSTSLQVQIDKRVVDGQKFGFEDPFVPWAIRDAREQKDVFGTFAAVASEVAEMDSLLYLGSLDEEAFDIRIDEIRRQRRAELSALARQQQQRQIEDQFRNGGAAAAADARNTSGGKNVGLPTAGGEDGETAESGFLYHRDPARVQDGFRNFVARWGERPPVPNWRLSSKLLATSDAQSEVPDKDLIKARQAAGNLLGSDSFGAEFDDVDVEDVPRTDEDRAAMRTARAEARYQVGTVLFLAMSRPDSAAAWFRKVITDDPDQPIAPKAYYALAEVNRALGDIARAEELQTALAEAYPGHGADDTETARDARLAAETEEAQRQYSVLYDAWQQNQYPTAATGLLALAEAADPTPVAPKALFAASSVIMDWAQTDSLSVLDPVELALSDSLAAWLGIEQDQ
ncbi:MAG: tetratricopeptide repeat protein, partial [Rhodothermales bacterium]|nr:tetratricopeptide repeat protein [Rhodothermales bacterium]